MYFRDSLHHCLFQPHLLVWRTGPGAEEDQAAGRPIFHPDFPHCGCAQEDAAHRFKHVYPRRPGTYLPCKVTIQLCKSLPVLAVHVIGVVTGARVRKAQSSCRGGLG